MITLKEADKIIKNKYSDAKYTYSLARKKAKLSTGEKLINAIIFLFTPFVRGARIMDGLSDFGIYYLVERNNKQILVRIDKVSKENLIEEKEISLNIIQNKFILGDDEFEKIREL